MPKSWKPGNMRFNIFNYLNIYIYIYLFTYLFIYLFIFQKNLNTFPIDTETLSYTVLELLFYLSYHISVPSYLAVARANVSFFTTTGPQNGDGFCDLRPSKKGKTRKNMMMDNENLSEKHNDNDKHRILLFQTH